MSCGLLDFDSLPSFVGRFLGLLDRDGGGEIDFCKDRGGVSFRGIFMYPEEACDFSTRELKSVGVANERLQMYGLTMIL